MRPRLIFGASRDIGLEPARLERGNGRPVHAMVRPGCEPATLAALHALGIETTSGDALNAEDVERAFRNHPAGCDVVSTIGGRAADGRHADDEGNINLIDEPNPRGG